LPESCRLAILTTGRQDYGILRSTILLLRRTPRIEVMLWAGGMHLDGRFGEPLALFDADGITPDRSLRFLSDPPDQAADLAGAIRQTAAALKADTPDALMLLGDRAETLAAAMAATLSQVPLVHLQGGEESEGSIDNACRHAVTKLSHLHLVSHPVHAKRVVQMGEDPASVIVVGAPGLDNASRDDLPGRQELEAGLGRRLEPPVVLVTLHPTTLGGAADEEVVATAAAMEQVPATYVVTSPNSDEGGAVIRASWRSWGARRKNVILTESLGDRRYWALLRLASAVLGNSSSGIIEAPALGVPVVNVGDRQRGRLRYGPVNDVPVETGAIARALTNALSRGRTRPDDLAQAYPAGPAAPRILKALQQWTIPRPPRKSFRDLS
jgi:UDP-N-acetylglucosamine 2-epimerase (non-hydrolysing)/GDP/UDP-N,N'-diacetylbacillosamine 2-epimerase (hydrolysing)